MKLILDFDDVLFKNTPEFKDWMFSRIEEAGIPRPEAEDLYKGDRASEFSLKNFLRKIFRGGEPGSIERLYEEIMEKCPELINEEMAEKARRAGKENCYLVTNGDKKFQEDKINLSCVAPLFKEIIIVPNSKKKAVEEICEKNPGEEIFFYDNREEFFADLNFKKYPELKTVLYGRG